MNAPPASSARPALGMNRWPLRFACVCRYIRRMNDLAYWSDALRKAERELDAATTRTAINSAAGRLMRIKGELKALERKAPTRRASGAAREPASP